MAGANSAAPIVGQEGSTALISTSAAVAVVRARHRAHGRDRRQGAVRAEKGALLAGQFAMDQRKGGVAAEDRAPVARQAVVEAARQRIDADDRRDAERDAGEENAQARKAAAQIAQGEAQDRQATRARRRWQLVAFTPPPNGVGLDRPDRSRIVRSQRAASAGSWVTSTSVAPRSRAQIEQQFDDRPAGRLVEIAGRLVGDQERGPRAKRARQRDALLLAAGKLRRIMRSAARRGRPPPVPRARASNASGAPGEFERRRDILERGHGRDQMERLEHDADRARRETAPARPRSSRSSDTPSILIEPLSGRSRPAIVISSVDLPDPDGPTSPTASPRAIVRLMLRRIWTRAAPRPKLKSRSRNSIAGSAMCGMFLNVEAGTHMGIVGTRVQLRWPWLSPLPRGRRRPARRTLQLVALGDSLTAGLGLPPGQAFPRCWRGRCGQRASTSTSAMPAFPATRPTTASRATTGRCRRTRTRSIVELGANDMLRGLDPAAKKALAAILTRPRQPIADAARRHARRAQSWRGLRPRFDAIYPDLPKQFGVALYPFFLDGVAADPKLNQKDGLHPTAAGVAVIVERILPSVEDLLRRARS